MIEQIIGRYIELKEQIKQLEDELKILQESLEQHFQETGIKDYVYNGYRLRRQERRSVNYTDGIVDYLKQKGFYEAVVSVDKKKLDKYIKAKLLKTEELLPYQEEKVSSVWVLEKINRNNVRE